MQLADTGTPDVDALIRAGWGDIPYRRIPSDIRECAALGLEPPRLKAGAALPVEAERRAVVRYHERQAAHCDYWCERPCFICGRRGHCRHREPQIADAEAYARLKKSRHGPANTGKRHSRLARRDEVA